MKRAYSLLTVKSVDEEHRIIEGIASTPKTDDIDVLRKVCASCSVDKPMSMFAHQKGCTDGHRAQCRECYNEGRRAHYQTVHDEKMRKRKVYQARPDVIERRKQLRHVPEVRAKEKAAAERYRAKPDVAEKLRVQRVQYRSSMAGRAASVLHAALTRATKGSLPFDLTLSWVAEKLIGGRCEVTGLPFQFDRNGGTRRNQFAPSIDQIAAGRGYTKDNCRIVLVAVNLALCDWGLEQFLHIAKHALIESGYKVGLCERERNAA